MIINMFKWFRLMRFIRKHRKKGMPSFKIITTSNEVIVTTRAVTKQDENYQKDQIRFNY
jgi:hypothetical protein